MAIIDEKFKRKKRKEERERQKEEERKKAAKAAQRPKPVYFHPLYYEVDIVISLSKHQSVSE